jgi:acyl-CoA synthetase (NDP forming)
MSCSGGEASLVADTAMGFDLRFRPYAETEKRAVADTLSPMVTVANPLDYHTFIWGDEAAHTQTFTAAMAPGFDLSMLILDFPREDKCSTETWEPAVNGIIAASEKTNARTVIVASLSELLPEDRCAQFIAAGIAPLCGIEDALVAADAAAAINEAWDAPSPIPLVATSINDPAASSVVLDEAEAKNRLRTFGVPVPKGFRVTNGREARKAANRAGYPVAVKGLGFAHKTEENAVFLNLRDAMSAEASAAGLLTRCDAVLIETMVPGGLVEMIVGVTRDPAYGLMLTVGAGGVMAELLEDTATLLLPSTDDEIAEAIASLKVAKLLAGWRGKPAADLPATIAAIQSVARFAEAHVDTLEELDINPLIVCEEGAFAADALIRISGAHSAKVDSGLLSECATKKEAP